MAAYCGNRDEAVEVVIDADAVAAAVRTMMAARTEWTGTASNLLALLGGRLARRGRRPRTGRTRRGCCRDGCAARPRAFGRLESISSSGVKVEPDADHSYNHRARKRGDTTLRTVRELDEASTDRGRWPMTQTDGRPSGSNHLKFNHEADADVADDDFPRNSHQSEVRSNARCRTAIGGTMTLYFVQAGNEDATA